MELQHTTPVELIQQFIAIHTTRKEEARRLKTQTADAGLQIRLQEMEEQSRESISTLMQELSNYGDAVSSTVEHDDAYQQAWKQASAGEEMLEAGSVADIISQTESILQEFYNRVLTDGVELPPEVNALLQQQANMLSQSA